MGDSRSTVIPSAQISTGFFGECCQSHSESSLEGVSVRQKGVKPNRERERERERVRESGRLGWDKLIFLVKSTAMSRSVCMTRAQICRPFLAPSRKGTDLRRFVWVSQGNMINVYVHVYIYLIWLQYICIYWPVQGWQWGFTFLISEVSKKQLHLQADLDQMHVQCLGLSRFWALRSIGTRLGRLQTGSTTIMNHPMSN